jgi:hypothetical protein
MLDLMTKQRFSETIERYALDKKCSYVDAITLWCEENEMEIDVAAKLVNGVIKEKLRVEYQDLNFLPKGAKLPI